MARRHAVLPLLAIVLALAGPAQAQAPVTLRIVFPEGFSVRQMADRVSEVRKIAIRKRHVTPRLTGPAYRAAAARARAPDAFRRYLKRRSVEGFLFPALYESRGTRRVTSWSRSSWQPSRNAGARFRADEAGRPTTS